MNKSFGVQFALIPKADWCLGLIIKSIIKSGRYRLKLSLKKKTRNIVPIKKKKKKKREVVVGLVAKYAVLEFLVRPHQEVEKKKGKCRF